MRGIRGRDPRGRERGQISIMVGMMIMTFILLFVFVVNTGMLVSAKINLQNAADLAAYAGAAVQARQLNTISYLNYEMRRQYKKFLFRYYVLGNMAQKAFPGTPVSPGTPALWSPDGGGTNYGVPSVCLIFNQNDNFCQLAKVPQIAIPKDASFGTDAIQSTLISQLQAIEAIRQKSCQSIGNLNTRTLWLWLMNTDPNFTLVPQSTDTAVQSMLALVQGVSQGLGLAPREAILFSRITTLATYLNTAAATGLTADQALALQKQLDPSKYERSIEAFYSAYYTLGEHTFDGSTVTMDELLPQGTQGSGTVNLKPIKATFDTYAITLTGPNANPDGTHPQDCTPQLTPVDLGPNGTELTVGVYKDPTVMTYYAVRIKAQARMLFSPFGNLTLKAYAAAQPYGSRIGPESGGQDWVREGLPQAGAPPTSLGFSPAGAVPNLPVNAGDTATPGHGWDTTFVLNSFLQPLKTGAPNSPIPYEELEKTYEAAMAPNPWEGNQYNIVNDMSSGSGPDPFVHNFDSNGIAAFWAPVVAPGTQDAADAIKKALQDFFAQEQQSQGQGAQTETQALVTGMQQAITTYIDNLRNGKGEELIPGVPQSAESINVVRLPDPFHYSAPAGGGLITLPPQIMVTDPKKFRTSFAPTEIDASVPDIGRVGYSVKFVSFDSLTSKQHRASTNGSGATWDNEMNLDPEATQDVPFLKH